MLEYLGAIKETQMANVKQVHNDYSVDDCGNVYNPKGRKMKPFLHKKGGYLQIDLGWKNRRRVFIHRLVAENFVSGYFEGAVIDHIDRDKYNNNASNLRWVTVKENYHNADNKKRAENISIGQKAAWDRRKRAGEI